MAIINSKYNIPKQGDTVKALKVLEKNPAGHIMEIEFESGKYIAFHYNEKE